MTRTRIAIVLGVVIAGGLAVVYWPRDDRSLGNALIGTWRATDTSNGALHGRKDGVKNEEATIDAGGKATYRLELTSQQTPTSVVLWGWKVDKSRLLLKDIGPESTQEWFKPLRFSVSRSTLTINRKGFPAKQFKRVSD